MSQNTKLIKKVSVTLRMNYQRVLEFVSADLRTDDTKLVRIARKLSKLEPKVQLRNFPSVEQIQDGSFEIFPAKCKKFENSLKLPGVLFSISLIIYNYLLNFSASRYLITLAGFPTTTALFGTSLVTTAPAPTTAFSPIVTPGSIVTFTPIHTLRFM